MNAWVARSVNSVVRTKELNVTRTLFFGGRDAVPANESRRDREQPRERQHHRFQEGQSGVPGSSLPNNARRRFGPGWGKHAPDEPPDRSRFTPRFDGKNFY